MDNSAAVLERVFALLARKGRAPADDPVGMIPQRPVVRHRGHGPVCHHRHQPGRDDSYPSRHSLQVAMLAISIGVRVGFDEDTLAALARGCLLHDLGTPGVDQAAFRHDRELSAEEFSEVVAHPVRVFAAAAVRPTHSHRRPPGGLSDPRCCDCSGYPRNVRAAKIHPLAKVAAVADVFVALISPRPHRRALAPYKALEKILY